MVAVPKVATHGGHAADPPPTGVMCVVGDDVPAASLAYSIHVYSEMIGGNMPTF